MGEAVGDSSEREGLRLAPASLILANRYAGVAWLQKGFGKCLRSTV